MSSKKDLENVISVLEDALESIYSILEKEQPEWYERKPFQNTMCWVSTTNKNPTKGDRMRIITGYHKDFLDPFCSIDGKTWKYAVPLTNEELLEYSVKEQERANINIR